MKNNIKKCAITIVLIFCAIGLIYFIPEWFPTSHSLISRCLKSQIKNNCITGSVSITAKTNINLSESDKTAYVKIHSNIDDFVIRNDRIEASGNILVDYTDLAESKGFYKIYTDLNKKEEYLYYSDKEPETDYLLKYDQWTKINLNIENLSNSDKENYNNPKQIKNALKKITDTNFDKNKFIITGKISYTNARPIIDMIKITDANNLTLINSIQGQDSADIEIKFDKKTHNIKKIILKYNAKKKNRNSVQLTLDINLTNKTNVNVEIPEKLKSNVSRIDFEIPTPTEKHNQDTETKIQSYEELGLIIDGQRVFFDNIKDLITSNTDYKKWEVSKDANLYITSLNTDDNAKIYLFTNEENSVTQIELDNVYSSVNPLKVFIGGLTFGCSKKDISDKFGDPVQTTSDPESTDFIYYVGQNKSYKVTFSFYDEKEGINSGLQKINILKY